MDGENHGSKPYFLMDDLVGFPPIFGSTSIFTATFPEICQPRHGSQVAVE